MPRWAQGPGCPAQLRPPHHASPAGAQAAGPVLSSTRCLGGTGPRCQATVRGVCETPHDTAFEAKSTCSVSCWGRGCDVAPPSASGVPRSDSGSGGDTGVAVAPLATVSCRKHWFLSTVPRTPNYPVFQFSYLNFVSLKMTCKFNLSFFSSRTAFI